MPLRVALNHRTVYRYDRPVHVSPQVIRLRPAPHARTPVPAYTLRVHPQPHFINWQQDPQSNWLARVVFPEKISEFEVEVDLIAEMAVFNPFDFFLDADAETVPFDYHTELKQDLAPFQRTIEAGPKLKSLIPQIELKGQRTIDFLVAINQRIQELVGYTIRMEPGIQTPEQTLSMASGSCRDSSWLLVQLLRHLGFAARFVSGYLIQLKPDQEALDGPSGATQDFTDLHAWCEVYVPGGGWIGLDPTSGLLTGEGHIPLAATPDPVSAAPVTGAIEKCGVSFEHQMSVKRVLETPRVTKPYSEEQWQAIDAVGQQVEADLKAQDMRLTMGGEPTFVSIDDMQGDEWNTAAVGPMKQGLAANLLMRLRDKFAPGGLMSYGQGKWYPGESLPRWAYSLIWRTDGQPIWRNPERLQLIGKDKPPKIEDAEAFMDGLCRRLRIDADCALPAYEDPLHFIKQEADLPADLDLSKADLDSDEDRRRIARVLSRGLGKARGMVLPIQRWQTRAGRHWVSERWKLRREKLYLLAGDSSVGLRLPLESLPGGTNGPKIRQIIVDDPFGPRIELPKRFQSRQPYLEALESELSPKQAARQVTELLRETRRRGEYHTAEGIRTAMVIEPDHGVLSVFMPPLENAQDFLELVAAIEDVSAQLKLPVRIEGYPPPQDPRLQQIKITPDPGVIEVNIHPSADWEDLKHNICSLYAEARQARLGTEKFMVDGKHTGTGGGNHIVVGGAQPQDSPFLRRPDMLGSVIRFWQNHPSLSYLFAGLFIGPTSQSPRVDEARQDTLYELDLALQQLPGPDQQQPPWLVDRILRNLLIDVTGNTHRAEICIDKLYSPDSPTGRLGLVEFRAFEMPPHERMSLMQLLLVRALLAWFWRQPYDKPLVRWESRLHDQMFLPHYLAADLRAVLGELRNAGYPIQNDWFAPHVDFRFPLYGSAQVGDLQLELRGALEAWPTMGEQGAVGGTARYVDSSVERVQLKVSGMQGERYVLSCNGRRLPLHSTDTPGEMVAGVRFRTWQPWSCLHPTVGAHNPLIFDVIDSWSQRAIGGCSYHVSHPGGRSFDTNPINSYEAESRRLSRFFSFGHTPGTVQVPAAERNAYHPHTLDLRRPPEYSSGL